jgi:hypothetical protein
MGEVAATAVEAAVKAEGSSGNRAVTRGRRLLAGERGLEKSRQGSQARARWEGAVGGV